LLYYAQRIKGRAVRRCGELLRQIPAIKGGDRKSDEYQCAGGDTLITRKQAAEDAGLSKRQKDDALRVASIDEEVFEEMIERDTPAKHAELVEMGIRKTCKEIKTYPRKWVGSLNFFLRGSADIDPVFISNNLFHYRDEVLEQIIEAEFILSTVKKLIEENPDENRERPGIVGQERDREDIE